MVSKTHSENTSSCYLLPPLICLSSNNMRLFSPEPDDGTELIFCTKTIVLIIYMFMVFYYKILVFYLRGILTLNEQLCANLKIFMNFDAQMNRQITKSYVITGPNKINVKYKIKQTKI